MLELTSEEIVTKLLTSKEVLNKTQDLGLFENYYDLGDYLQNLPPEPLPYGGKYQFIK